MNPHTIAFQFQIGSNQFHFWNNQFQTEINQVEESVNCDNASQRTPGGRPCAMGHLKSLPDKVGQMRLHSNQCTTKLVTVLPNVLRKVSRCIWGYQQQCNIFLN